MYEYKTRFIVSHGCVIIAADIEELTRKTGNFKKFPVFLNMLESAITKSSKSVILDLLTYEDLEAMWKKKLGTDKRGKRDSSNPHAKRYLILTYNVEFDRIHYPLALSYCGCPDPVVLQDVIRELQAELKKQVCSFCGYVVKYYGFLHALLASVLVWNGRTD